MFTLAPDGHHHSPPDFVSLLLALEQLRLAADAATQPKLLARRRVVDAQGAIALELLQLWPSRTLGQVLDRAVREHAWLLVTAWEE